MFVLLLYFKKNKQSVLFYFGSFLINNNIQWLGRVFKEKLLPSFSINNVWLIKRKQEQGPVKRNNFVFHLVKKSMFNIYMPILQIKTRIFHIKFSGFEAGILNLFWVWKLLPRKQMPSFQGFTHFKLRASALT